MPLHRLHFIVSIVSCEGGSTSIWFVSYGPIIYSKYMTLLRGLLCRAGYRGLNFLSHSFRRGGATYAFKSGVPDFLIKIQGDLASDAYRENIDVLLEQRLQVFNSMTYNL